MSDIRQINFIKPNSKKLFDISMRNYSLNMRTGESEISTLKSNYTREIYKLLTDNLGLAKYTMNQTEYKGKGKTDFNKWTFASGAEFYNTIYYIPDDNYRHSLYQKASGEKIYPTLEESFRKYPKLPSVYLLIMLAFDIITLDAYLSIINSNCCTNTITTKYIKINEISQKHIEIGAGKYSNNSYFYNDDFYIRLIGNGIYMDKPCWIYDYYSEPSEVFMKEIASNQTKKNKSLYSGRIYIDKDDGDILCGEMNENVIPIGNTSSFVNRRILLEMKGEMQ